MTAIVTRGNAADLHLPDETVDLIVTSPPHFGLRSYQDGGEHYAGQIGDEDEEGVVTGKCGTPAGYQDHHDNGTPRCRPCKDAQAAWQRAYRKRTYLARGPLLVDACGTRRRLRALAWMGWSWADIGAQIGCSHQAVSGYTLRGKVTRDTAAKVAAVYDLLWNRRGPSPKAAARARTNGWQPALAWSDDTIDDPRARPTRMVASRTAEPLDEIAVERAMRGDCKRIRPVERAEAVRRLTAVGLSAAEIAERLGVTDRTVTRKRSAAA